MKHIRRRVFPVIKPLQYRFLANSLVYSFIIVCFFAVAVFGPDMLEMLDPGLSLDVRGNAASRVLAKHSWVWVAVVPLIIILAMHSFSMLLKILGPLHRFRWALEQLRNGNVLSGIKIRKRDYLRQEEDAFNKMLEVFSGKLWGVKEASEDALKSIGELEQTVNKGNEWNEAQMDLLRAHREHLERLAVAVQFFRLEDKA